MPKYLWFSTSLFCEEEPPVAEKDDDEEIDPEIRELGDYFNIEAPHKKLSCKSRGLILEHWPGKMDQKIERNYEQALKAELHVGPK